MTLTYFLAILTILFANTPSQDSQIGKYFKGYDGCFVIYNITDDNYFRYNKEKCKKPVSPCSTFKIMNSLIGLETGVVEDENTMFKWDGKKRFLESWNRDHTLASAIKNSVVWYYQRLAEKIGKKRMQYYLDKVNYGNKDISGGLTTFWLNSSLKISPDDQVKFLTKLYKNQLPFKKRNMEIVKKIIIQKQTKTTTFSGKTGTAMVDGKTTIGWFVGYVKKDGKEYVFAVNIEGKDGATGSKARGIAEGILRELLKI